MADARAARVDQRKSLVDQAVLDVHGVDVHLGAFFCALLEMLDAGKGAGCGARWEGGGKDEARGAAPHGVDQGCRAGAVAAHYAVSLREGARDHGDPLEDVVAFGDASAAPPVQAHSVHLVAKGHGTVLVGEVADDFHGGDGTWGGGGGGCNHAAAKEPRGESVGGDGINLPSS